MRRIAWLLALLALASACATPVGVSTSHPRAIHRYLT
jgi:cytochrome c oxidase assembly factor CtaG